MGSNRQLAFLFNEAGDMTPEQIGGKAMSLVTMSRLGMPVPPGFVVRTGTSRAYLQEARFPRRLDWHVRRCVATLERQTGKRFGDPSNPLLVSVRSGAPVSMPGMMDTILNLGMTSEMIPVLAETHGREFARDTFDRFYAGYKGVTGSVPGKPWEQLELAIEAISMSWLNDRAVEYRRVHKIPDNIGTAMVVQVMVFGNRDHSSGTGVLFSRNVVTGDKELYGEFLVNAQGEDVVGGGVTPLPIGEFAKLHPQAFRELTEYARQLEDLHNDVVEIEFTVESGKIWILQYRVAKRAPVAAARFAVQFQWEKRISKSEAVVRVSDAEVKALHQYEFSQEGSTIPRVKGLSASPGAEIGIAVFSSEEAIRLSKEGKKVILFRPDTNPDDFQGMLVASAIVTGTGGTTSHAAVVARELGKPCVVGVADYFRAGIQTGDLVSVDGSSGTVFLGALPYTPTASLHKEVSIFLRWLSQIRPKPKGRADFSSLERIFSANRMLNEFYISESMAEETRGTETELEKGVRVLRDRIHKETAEVFAAYLMLAVAGELRHGWSYEEEDRGRGRGRWRAPVFEELENRFGLKKKGENTGDRQDAQMAVVAKLCEMGADGQEMFLSLAVQAFESWPPGRNTFGGQSWAEIARTVLAFLSGDTNSTVFVDRVFDLRHNGGRLFDKHEMFYGRTDEGLLQAQLNVKRTSRTLDELANRLTIAVMNRHSFDSFNSCVKGVMSAEVKSLLEKCYEAKEKEGK